MITPQHLSLNVKKIIFKPEETEDTHLPPLGKAGLASILPKRDHAKVSLFSQIQMHGTSWPEIQILQLTPKGKLTAFPIPPIRIQHKSLTLKGERHLNVDVMISS